MSGRNKDIWNEVEADLKEKTESGYKMALIDSDKALRISLKEKGYPGKNLKKQLFWAGINLGGRGDLKNALKKKEEVLNEKDYRLSTFELEDYLEAYKKAVEWVESSQELRFKRKIGLYLENYLFLKNVSKSKTLIVALAVFFGIKFLSSTEIGKNIIQKIVDIDNLLFGWFKLLLILFLAIAIIVFAIFIYLDKKKKIRVKE